MKNYQNIKIGKKIKIPRVSHLEEKFAYQIKTVGIPTPIREYKFHPDRKWRFDFYWETGWAVEINGGGWQGGGHNRHPLKLWENYEKYNDTDIDERLAVSSCSLSGDRVFTIVVLEDEVGGGGG